MSDATPADSLDLDADLRAGWLLRSWRLRLAPDSNARTFAERLTDIGRSADTSRVSRWETGRLPVPLDVVAAYEQALVLPRGTLVALTMLTRRLAHPRGDLRQVLDPRHVDVQRFQEALDVTVDGNPCGGDWLDVASFVASRPSQAILPTSTWQRLVRHLVHDLVISVGAAYATRNLAAQLLGLHPAARRAVVLSVAEHVADNRSLVVADAISLLKQIEDPGAADLVIRLLGNPDEATRNGAISAVVGKLSRGHFDAARLADLEVALTELVGQDGLESGGLFARVADVLTLLPDDVRRRVRRAATAPIARGRPAGRRTRPLPRIALSRVVRSIARPQEEPEEPMLERLVEEALSHRVSERRFQSGLSIALSPYRSRVARGAAAQLREHAESDLSLAERIMVLLTLVATEEQRDHMRTLAEDPSSPLRVGALLAVAHLPLPGGQRRPDLWALTAPGEADDPTVRASIYCAGMTADPVLAAVGADARHPDWVRASADWWRHEGPGIHEAPPVL